jgi:DNA-binding beta-propeller fold protein YncE
VRPLPSLLLPVVLATLAACTAEEVVPDAAVDGGIIYVPPIDAPVVRIDAKIFDAPPPTADAPQPDAFPFTCALNPLDRNVATLAGCSTTGTTDGARNLVRFNDPVNVLRGPDGLYVADYNNHRIRRINTSNGDTTTVVSQTGFRRPWGMAFAADGTLYVQTDEDDSGNFNNNAGTIWVVDRAAPAGMRATVVLHDAGRPRGMAALSDGRIALADPEHHLIRLFVKTQEMDQPPVYSLQSLAGGNNMAGFVNATGGAARFNRPSGIAALADDTLVVADRMNHRIRLVKLDGVVTTYAGQGGMGADDGATGAARFNEPFDVAAATTSGDVFVADGENHLLRKIAGGMVSTVAGSGQSGFQDSDDRLMAEFFGMEGLDAAPDGKTVWIADGSRGDDVPYHRVRRVRF